MTLMFDSGVILKGEIRCSSPSGIKGLSLYQIKSAPSSSLNHQGSFFNFFSKSRKAKKKKITILAKRDWKKRRHRSLKTQSEKLQITLNH